MSEYRVTWSIDVDADSPQEAAEQARFMMPWPEDYAKRTTATVFCVTPHAKHSKTVIVDLAS